MKKKLTCILIFLSLIIGSNLYAQTTVNCPGDSVYLELPVYSGSIQWQESTDTITWINISGATYQPYGFVFTGSKFYRAMVTASGCGPIYSPIKNILQDLNCPVYAPGSIFCSGAVTRVNDVVNAYTGVTWMDRNLGASRAAQTTTDALSYGDIYQWGRRADGHQCRNSLTTSTLSSSDQPSHGNFIIISSGNFDWRNPQNTNLWQGVNGINNPCPSGYRVPTYAEVDAERDSWIRTPLFSSNSLTGSMASPLKIPAAGDRFNHNGVIGNLDARGHTWTSTINGTSSYVIIITTTDAIMFSYNRANGYEVRCIKEASGTIGALNCGSATQTGDVIVGQNTSGISITLPYTSGNGGYYAAQNIASTGVTGLTAALTTGYFANGSGTVTYSINGTAVSSGTATFAISLGGKSCNLSITVYPPQPAYPSGTQHCGGVVTIVNDVTNPYTGKTWMDRNLGARRVAQNTIDTSSYGSLYQWGRASDGHQCRNSASTSNLSSIDQPGINQFIIENAAPNDWRVPQNSNLWQGLNGINNPCPSNYRIPTETEMNNERLSWVQAPISSSNTATGAFASPLKFSLTGKRRNYDGAKTEVGLYGNCWTSTVNSTFSKCLNYISSNALIQTSYLRSYGAPVRCIKEYNGTIGSLNCGSATQTGDIIVNQAASGVSVSITYTGADDGFYESQTVSSTGITGLTAILSSGNFKNGSSTLYYTINGTAVSSGTATFAISIGGQSCSFSVEVYPPQPAYPSGTVHCGGVATIVNDVTSPTGKIWMDRNLGARRVAQSSTDTSSYGSLYQWGRASDGHQCRNSTTTSTLSSTDQPGHGNFILSPNIPSDWRNPQNINLWQGGVNSVNNPCPSGYRLPTDAELDLEERPSWNFNNSAGAFNSPLKWSVSGYRSFSFGTLLNVGSSGYYWSSNIASTGAIYLVFNSSSGSNASNNRANGMSVRCIKD